VLDKENYRYQATTSDIAGQDIKVHDNCPKKIIDAVRDFLNTHHYKNYNETIYGSDKILEYYEEFEKQKPLIARKLNMNEGKLTYVDYVRVIELWQETIIKV
jgi:predicted SnoaL-like aldol condensation-catalyzing enzyme